MDILVFKQGRVQQENSPRAFRRLHLEAVCGMSTPRSLARAGNMTLLATGGPGSAHDQRMVSTAVFVTLVSNMGLDTPSVAFQI